MGIKTINFITIQTRLLLMNALVVSHLHYSSIVINSISKHLVTSLEKQMSWAVKSCFNRNKFDSSSDLKLKHKILPIRYFLNMKLLNYFYKMNLKKLPAFCRQSCPNYKIKTNDRTNKLHFTVKYKSDVLKNSLIRQACTIWNEAESQIPLSTKMSSNTLKRYTK